MSNIVPFNPATSVGFVLPSHLADKFKSNIGASGSVPTLSIKGKVWTAVRDGAESVYMDEEGNALPTLKVVVLGQSMQPDGRPARTRSYFESAYDGTNQMPACHSYDGVSPSDDAENPQAKTCQGCEKAIKGSHSDGIRSACQTGKRLAVIPSSDLKHDAFLMKLPITSIWTESDPYAERGWYCWDSYMKFLKRHNVPHTAMIETSMRFVPTSEYPQVVFKYTGQLGEEGLETVAGRIDSDEVKHILGMDRGYATRIGKADEPAQEVPKPTPKAAPVDDFDEPAPAPKVEKPKAAPKAKPAPAPAAKAAPVDDFDEPAPVAKPAPDVSEKATVVSDMNDLASALTDWD